MNCPADNYISNDVSSACYRTLTSNSPVTYSAAHSLCAQYGLELPQPRTQGENGALDALTTGQFWLGATEDLGGAWSWADRYDITWGNWASWVTSSGAGGRCAHVINEVFSSRTGYAAGLWDRQDCDVTLSTTVVCQTGES